MEITEHNVVPLSRFFAPIKKVPAAVTLNSEKEALPSTLVSEIAEDTELWDMGELHKESVYADKMTESPGMGFP